MKDLQKECLRLASAMEGWWPSRDDRRRAAIFLRNAAIETPHCKFCGRDKNEVGALYSSRYDPRAHICLECVCWIQRESHAPQSTVAVYNGSQATGSEGCHSTDRSTI